MIATVWFITINWVDDEQILKSKISLFLSLRRDIWCVTVPVCLTRVRMFPLIFECFLNNWTWVLVNTVFLAPSSRFVQQLPQEQNR